MFLDACHNNKNGIIMLVLNVFLPQADLAKTSLTGAEQDSWSFWDCATSISE